MEPGYHDKALGPTDVGGLVFATVQCPIFDPRSEDDQGNFQWVGLGTSVPLDPNDQPLNNKRIQETRKPLETFNPFGTPGYVRVVNPLALHYYEISEQYQCSKEGFHGANWLNLLRIGQSVLEQEQSIGAFIDRITVRVRLAASLEVGWQASAKTHIMQVTTPAFGQIIQDESIAFPIHPPAHNQDSRKALTNTFEEINRRARAFDRRVVNDGTR